MKRSNTEKVIIEARKISKSFPGVRALHKVDFKVYAGKVNAVVGENGAGKSTLMNILSGVYTEYEGELLLNGQKVAFKDTTDARDAGISIIHQELQLAPNMSIAENIFLGREPLNKLGFIDTKKMEEEAHALLKKLEFDTDVNKKIATLRIGQQQIVEIAKALSFEAQALIMDEPTSALSESETNTLFKLIDSLKEKGVAIIYITHKMDELTQLADYVTVLRDGEFICESAVNNISVDEVVKLMVGRDIKDFFVKQRHEKGAVQLKIEDMILKKSKKNGQFLLKDISFSVHSSEVLGIYGLMGAGRTEFLETLLGIREKGSGILSYYSNEIIKKNTTREIMNLGIYLVPENRAEDGLFENFNLKQNISIGYLSYLTKTLLSLIDFKKETIYAKKVANSKELTIKYKDINQYIDELSGGNKQKIVIGRWISQENIKLLMLDEPTQGIDVGTKYELYVFIRKIAEYKKCGVIFSSSEIPEIVGTCDRIYVFKNGTISKEFKHRKDFDLDNILTYAL